jgi:undecaprenyl-diphosphatase
VPTARITALFRQLDAYELGLCLRANRACRAHPVERLFASVSRLGDGLIWYAAMAGLPVLDGVRGLAVSLRMLATGLAGVALYKLLKHGLARRRPFASHRQIRPVTAPLDGYSFPSGHTLHAVAFTAMLSSYYPSLGPVLVGFTVLVSLSRVVLGLHYPSDVVAGAVIGVMLASVALSL